MTEDLTIGMLAEAAGVSVKTVRHYSDQGLLPGAGRSGGGHRRYDAADLARLRELRGLRALGLPLPVSGAVARGELTLADALAEQQAEVSRRLTELHWRSAALAAMTEAPEHLLLLGEALPHAPNRDAFADFWRRVLPVRLPAALKAAIIDAAVPELPTVPSPGHALAYAELHALAADRHRTAEARVPEGDCDLTRYYQGLGEAYELAERPAGSAGSASSDALDAFVAAHAAAERRVDTVDFRRELAARPPGPGADTVARYWCLAGQLHPRPTMGSTHVRLADHLTRWVRERQ